MRLRLSVVAVLAAALATPAADVTWDNGASNFVWNTTSANWSGAVWNNAAGDGAIFGAAGVGTVSVPGPVSVDSLSFTADGYTLTGAGPVNIVAGTSTQTTAVVNTAAGVTATLNAPLTTALGFQKIGAGTLVLGGANTFTGSPIALAGGRLPVAVMIGGTNGPIASGTVRVQSQAALPATTNVGIGNGYLDIGANNITLNSLTFTNQTGSTSVPWNTTLNANNGVVGTGTLRVTGEISVIGVTGSNLGNTVATPLNLGGGTQVVRVGVVSSFGLSGAMMFTGPLSNGSLVKTIGYTQTGSIGSIDGIGLFANNTYTGSSAFNSGTNILTGTNATTSAKVVGLGVLGAGGSIMSLQGANGSLGAATTVQAFAGGSIVLDNNAALGASGNNQPNIPAAQNNDRLRDDAAVELRDGGFIYRAQTSATASETIGSLTASGGYNTVTLTPNSGTATLTVAGNLTLGSRAGLGISVTGTGVTLGSTAKLFVGGTLPTPDATGILPRLVSTVDFLTYVPATGLTPLSTYSSTLATGTNVSLASAAATAGSVSVNAIKTTATLTTTLTGSDTLTVASGMLLAASGTHTVGGTGTLAFGSTPGFTFGTNTVSAAVTGSQGLIVPTGTTTLSGNTSGLAGTITVQTGTLTLSGTQLTTAPIEVRTGTLNFNASQAGAGLGAITLGVPQNDADLFGGVPTFNFSGAGAGASIDRPIIVDNGAKTVAGLALPAGLVARFSPLSNATGSQALNGNLTLNSDVNLQGGGGGGTGATTFSGVISGAGRFIIPNGRVTFTAPSSVQNTGGFLIGGTGFTAQVSFLGATSGNGPLGLIGGNSSFVSYAAGSLPGGPITIQGGAGSSAITLTAPVSTTTIGNSVALTGGDLIASVPAGANSVWSGAVSGSGALTKSGTGTLTLSGASPAYTGAVSVAAGTLAVTGTASAGSVAVASGGSLQGNGTLTAPVTVAAGGLLKGGNSIGTLTVAGNVSLAAAAGTGATLRVEGDSGSNSLVRVTGAANTFALTGLTGSNVVNIDLVTSGLTPFTPVSWELARTIDNPNGLLVNGSSNFGVVPAANYVVTANVLITNVSLTASGNNLILAFTPVPEPGLVAVVAAAGLWAVRRRRVVG